MQATKPKRYTVNEKWDFVFIPPTILPTCLFLHDKRCKVAKYFQTHKHNKYKNTYLVQHWVNCFLSVTSVVEFCGRESIDFMKKSFFDLTFTDVHTKRQKLGTILENKVD